MRCCPRADPESLNEQVAAKQYESGLIGLRAGWVDGHQRAALVGEPYQKILALQ